MKATSLRLVTVEETRVQEAGIGQRRGNVSRLQTLCSNCNLREVCLPNGCAAADKQRIDDLIYTRIRVRQGEQLYGAGEHFHALYAVRTGFLKSNVIFEDGREQVTGFFMAGEIVGMDGIGSDVHQCNVVALEDSDICVIPYARLSDISRDKPGLQHHVNRIMSHEIVRDQSIMLLLRNMRSDERLATFLLNLSQRYLARGYSPYDFHLRMTREDIGSFLGMRIETISRAFSKFQDEGLIEVENKHIRIVDLDGLKRIGGHTEH